MTVLVGREAPDFTVPAVLGSGEIVDNFNLTDAISGQYGLVFFYPLDFTFVCPSELIALDHVIDEFKKRADLDLVDTDLFGNQLEIHKDYFKHVVKYEQNPQTRKFLMNVASFYNHTDSVNSASFEFSKLFRYYVFRKTEK